MFTKKITILIAVLIFFEFSASARRVKDTPSVSVSVFAEKEAGDLSARIAEELNLDKKPYNSLQRALVPYYFGDIYRFGKKEYVFESYIQNSDIEFVRLGYLFFVDSQRIGDLSPELKSELGANLIVIKGLNNSNLVDFNMQQYTLATIIAMLNCDLVGKRVIDCGAGEGILSVVAARLGAKYVELIEIDDFLLTKARENLRLNGLQEGKDYNLIPEDLRNTARVLNQLKEVVCETAVISNIGTWPRSYNVTNQTSMDLLLYIQNVTLFIAGGYNTRYHERVIRNDIKIIRSLGFKVKRKKATIGFMFYHVAWIAEK